MTSEPPFQMSVPLRDDWGFLVLVWKYPYSILNKVVGRRPICSASSRGPVAFAPAHNPTRRRARSCAPRRVSAASSPVSRVSLLRFRFDDGGDLEGGSSPRSLMPNKRRAWWTVGRKRPGRYARDPDHPATHPDHPARIEHTRIRRNERRELSRGLSSDPCNVGHSKSSAVSIPSPAG